MRVCGDDPCEGDGSYKERPCKSEPHKGWQSQGMVVTKQLQGDEPFEGACVNLQQCFFQVPFVSRVITLFLCLTGKRSKVSGRRSPSTGPQYARFRLFVFFVTSTSVQRNEQRYFSASALLRATAICRLFIRDIGTNFRSQNMQSRPPDVDLEPCKSHAKEASWNIPDLQFSMLSPATQY